MSITLRSVIAFAAAPALMATAAIATPVAAQAPAKQVAELAAAAKDAKVIGKGVVWRCNGTNCVAPEGPSRPAVSCAALVKQAGKVTAFNVNGVGLDEAALERCNSFARD